MEVTPNSDGKVKKLTPPQTGHAVFDSNNLIYTDEEVEFIKAIDAYKNKHNRKFPTYHEVLAVLKSLGYRK